MTSIDHVHRVIAMDELVPMIGQVLEADCTPRPAQLVLLAVEPHSRQIAARPSFTLIFRSPAAIQLIAGLYPLRGAAFGPAIVYLEPMLPPRDAGAGNYYQAVFN